MKQESKVSQERKPIRVRLVLVASREVRGLKARLVRSVHADSRERRVIKGSRVIQALASRELQVQPDLGGIQAQQDPSGVRVQSDRLVRQAPGQLVQPDRSVGRVLRVPRASKAKRARSDPQDRQVLKDLPGLQVSKGSLAQARPARPVRVVLSVRQAKRESRVM